jgi:hypothetical protein
VYLGEINPSPALARRKSIEVFDEDVGRVTAGSVLDRPPAAEPQEYAVGSGPDVLPAHRPGGESKLHRDWFGRSATATSWESDFRLAEPHNLYARHDFLLKHKADLFSHLVTRWRDLVNVEFDVLLYNLTSTYFEINAAPSRFASLAGANETLGGRARGRQAPPRLQPRQTAGLSAGGDRAGGHARRSAAGLRGAAGQYRGLQDVADVPPQC